LLLYWALIIEILSINKELSICYATSFVQRITRCTISFNVHVISVCVQDGFHSLQVNFLVSFITDKVIWVLGIQIRAKWKLLSLSLLQEIALIFFFLFFFLMLYWLFEALTAKWTFLNFCLFFLIISMFYSFFLVRISRWLSIPFKFLIYILFYSFLINFTYEIL